MTAAFTFCVLAYNHEKYILEHLDSIKYQVTEYGREVDVSLIINDDCSSDATLNLVEGWVSENNHFFKDILKLFNEKNIGTCKSLINVAKSIKTKYCKITAGDDVYTQNNIFDLIQENPDYSLMSGVPVRLVDGEVKVSLFEVFNYFASDYIYKKRSLLYRLSNLSVINAPNLFYGTHHLKEDSVVSFLKGFDVVEDLPLQVSIALSDSNSNIISKKLPIVFYRRTSGSTYLIENKKFTKDQVKMFDFLISHYQNNGDHIQAALLRNRKFVFLQKNKAIKKIFNLSYYLYLARMFFHLPKIMRDYKRVKLNSSEYQKFYDALKDGRR